LKKRTKKLLSVAGRTVLAHLNRLLDAISKSFLLLFFKKEVLPSARPSDAASPPVEAKREHAALATALSPTAAIKLS
jgi:hypothetical protein